MIIVGLAIMANGQEITTNKCDIIVNTNEDETLSVKETYTIDTTSTEIFNIWIQDDATGISFQVNSQAPEYELTVDNVYQINTSGIDISSIEVTYILDKSIDGLQKTFQYNTTSFTITFDGLEIYSGSGIKDGSSIDVAFQKPITKTKTVTTTTYDIPTWYYLILIGLIILVLLSIVFPSKKHKTTKKKDTTAGSEELFSTKKTLLMELLKDIEKQHRAKKISDDTYHKLKAEYKQDAVDAMKKLEDVKSKVK